MNRKLLLLFALTLLVIATGCTTPVPYSPAPVKPTLPATGSFDCPQSLRGLKYTWTGYTGEQRRHVFPMCPRVPIPWNFAPGSIIHGQQRWWSRQGSPHI